MQRIVQSFAGAWRAMSGTGLTELHVFLSSPGECAEERNLVESLIEQINSSPEAIAQRIGLRSLRWESLPPGDTKDGDYQQLINRMLQEAGLNRFEVYLGFVRSRLGTPTPRYDSGTVEEFEIALSEQRKRGLPGEVLFYFLGPSVARSQDVENFRRALEKRKFLYSNAESREQFEALLRAHLLHIVKTWRAWKNRLRRLFHLLKLLARAGALVFLLAYLVFETATVVQVRADIGAGKDVQAVRRWSGRERYLPISSTIVRGDIDTALFRISSDRLTESLLAQGIDPYTWKRKHLRSFEIAALTRYAKEQLARMDQAGASFDERTLQAFVALTEDWARARRLASEATRPDSRAGVAPVQAFIANAPSAVVVDWLGSGIAAGVPVPVAGAILDTAASRADPAITLATLEALRMHKLGDTGERLDLRLDCLPSVAACAASAHMLRRWLGGDLEALPVNALGLLVTWAQPSGLSADDRQFVDARIVALLERKRFDDISPALIGYLGRSNSVVARKALSARIARHVSGELSFGFVERAALIDATSESGLDEDGAVQLQLARRSRDESAELRSSKYPPSDSGVQAAYLRWVARHGIARWPVHAKWVKQLLTRRQNGEIDSFTTATFDDAFRALLERLDESAFADLFGAFAAPVVDTFDLSASARRAYLLSLLSDAALAQPAWRVNLSCRSIPVDQEHRAAFYRFLATAGGATGQGCLRAQWPGDPAVLPFLGDAKDVQMLTGLTGDPAYQILAFRQALFDAALHLPEAQQREFIAHALTKLPRKDWHELWPLATASRSDQAGLVASAIAEIGKPDGPAQLAAAVRYLDAVRPSDVWPSLNDAGASLAFIALMREAEPFDYIRVAQEMPELPGTTAAGGVNTLREILRARPLLLVLKASGVSPVAWLPDRLMVANDSAVGNPLWRLMVLQPDSSEAAALLQEQIEAEPRAKALGEVGDPPATYRAYLAWLLAEVVASPHFTDRDKVPLDMLVQWIGNADPSSSRAFAGLTLASLAPREYRMGK